MKKQTTDWIFAVAAGILAAVLAILLVPKPTGDSSVYEQYTEEMREAGRYPNGELIGSEEQQKERARMQRAGIWLELGP